jgi:hypothetical protein
MHRPTTCVTVSQVIRSPRSRAADPGVHVPDLGVHVADLAVHVPAIQVFTCRRSGRSRGRSSCSDRGDLSVHVNAISAPYPRALHLATMSTRRVRAVRSTRFALSAADVDQSVSNLSRRCASQAL